MAAFVASVLKSFCALMLWRCLVWVAGHRMAPRAQETDRPPHPYTLSLSPMAADTSSAQSGVSN